MTSSTQVSLTWGEWALEYPCPVVNSRLAGCNEELWAVCKLSSRKIQVNFIMMRYQSSRKAHLTTLPHCVTLLDAIVYTDWATQLHNSYFCSMFGCFYLYTDQKKLNKTMPSPVSNMLLAHAAAIPGNANVGLATSDADDELGGKYLIHCKNHNKYDLEEVTNTYWLIDNVQQLRHQWHVNPICLCCNSFNDISYSQQYPSFTTDDFHRYSFAHCCHCASNSSAMFTDCLGAK